jgi:hypothetical protein
VRARSTASGAARRGHRVVLPLIVGAVLVSGIATPALASTDAGLGAIHDMGSMDTDMHGGH